MRVTATRALRFAVAMVTLAMFMDLPDLGAQQAALTPLAKNPHSLTVDDVLLNQEITDVAVSPNGQFAVVVVQRPRLAGADRYGWSYLGRSDRTDLWLIERNGGPPKNLTRGAIDGSWYWRPVWAPNSRRFALLSTRGGDNVRLYVWEIETAHLWRVDERGVQLEATFGEGGPPMAWLNSRELICAFLPWGARPFRFATGGPIRRLVRDGEWIKAERGSETSVSVLEGGIALPESLRPQGSLALIDLRTRRVKMLAEANIRTVAISPDNHYAAVIAEAGGILLDPARQVQAPTDQHSGHYLHLGVHRRLGVVALTGRRPIQWVTDLIQPRFAIPSRSWAPDASAFVVLSRRTASDSEETVATLIKANAEVLGPARDSSLIVESVPSTPLPEVPSTLQLRGWSAITGFAVFTSEPRDGTLLWTRDSIGAEPQLRLRLNGHLAAVSDDVGRDSVIRYRGWDGREYNGHLILPARYSPGTRYPVIVWVYPGEIVPDSLPYRESTKPHSSRIASLEPRLFTTHGYVVLQPTIPPSSGDPMLSMPGYVLPAVDMVIGAGIADSMKLALFGQSHGAVATYGLLTQTDRFRAAIAINGVSDILHEYAGFNASNIESDFPGEWATPAMREFERAPHGLWMAAMPWDEPQRWLRNNPIYHFDRVRTPLLIVQSDNDIFYMSASDVAFQSLHRLGKRVRYVRYWGEAHTIQSPANTRDLWRRMYDWLDQNLEITAATGRAVSN